MKYAQIALCAALASCNAAPATVTSTPLPDNGNAVLTLTDLPGEHPATVYAEAAGLGGDAINLVFSSSAGEIGFARSYTLDEWQRLMDGERLDLGFQPGGHAYISTVYEVRQGDRIGRDAISEQLRRDGDLFVWTIDFSEATDSLLETLSDELASVRATITFSAEFQCSTCIPGSEMAGGGCLAQADPTFQSDRCLAVVRDFQLAEYGFVDPAVLE